MVNSQGVILLRVGHDQDSGKDQFLILRARCLQTASVPIRGLQEPFRGCDPHIYLEEMEVVLGLAALRPVQGRGPLGGLRLPWA